MTMFRAECVGVSILVGEEAWAFIAARWEALLVRRHGCAGQSAVREIKRHAPARKTATRATKSLPQGQSARKTAPALVGQEERKYFRPAISAAEG